MSYMNLDSLKRYAQKEKEWSDEKFLSENDLNWQKTEKAGAVTCYPIGESPLEGIVEFKFKETPPVEGEKSPSNPSTITGVSSIDVMQYGKNLCPSSEWEIGQYTTTGSSFYSLDTRKTSPFIPIIPNTSFTMSVDQNEFVGIAWINYNYFDKQKNWLGSRTENGESSFSGERTHTFNISDPRAAYIRLVVRGYSSTNTSILNVDIATATPQLELGNAVTSYEACNGNSFTISLSNTYYGGSIDPKTGLMMVTWYGHVFSGEESFNKSVSNNNSYYTFITPYPAKTTTSCICTHFLAGGAPGNLYTKTNEGKIVFINNNIDSTENLKAWFSEENTNNTPITVVYELATPYTVQLTPTQILSLPLLDKCTPRVNTIYTDADSIQVGYAKHPSRTAYELQQAIIAGGNH